MNDDIISFYNIENITDIYESIDRINDKCTHYDASKIVYKILKNMYRYIGDNKWEFLDKQDNQWKIDTVRRKLKTDIKTVVADIITKRYLYLYINNINNDDFYNKYTLNKMLSFSYKMKNDKFISVVIKEAQSFFDIHRYD